MALQSQLFRGDPKLEAAAVSDPAHILRGAAGSHVRKIQLALIKLDRAVIAQNELQQSVNGPATANAVLAYKRKRDIVNRSYQKQADNIVGKMTMASLDKEMLTIEALPTGPPGIVPILPPPRVIFRDSAARAPVPVALSRFGLFGAPTLPRIIPGNSNLQIEIAVNGFATFQVVNGLGETAACDKDSIGVVFDPADPSAQGAVFVEKDPHLCKVRGKRSGTASILVTQSNAQGIPIGFVRLPLEVGKVTPKRPFVSQKGTPVNPIGTQRMINIFGENEREPGFENFVTDPKFTVGNNGVPRPFTNDPNKPPGVANKTASDICLRDSPISQVTINEIKRIAMPGCRLTIALNSGPKDDEPGGTNEQLKRVSDAFVPPAEVFQEGRHDEINERDGKPTVRRVLVIEIP